MVDDNQLKMANACMENNLQVVQELLSTASSSSSNKEQFFSPVNWKDSDGKEFHSPPLFIAIDYEYIDIVKEFLKHNKSVVDLKDENDYTPIQWASWNGYLEIVKCLLEYGALADEECFELAKENDHTEVANLLSVQNKDKLYSNLEDDDAIMDKACRLGDLAKVKSMLQNGYDYQKWKDDDGKYQQYSPMFMAIKFGHMDIVQVFAEKGMEVEAPSST